MAFVKIDWKPNARHLRMFAITILCAMGAVGAFFYWGGAYFGVPFFDRPGFGVVLWSFSAVAFLTGITGTKLGLPTYYLWMGFVFVISSILGYGALVLTYLLVVTPLGLLARLTGRDKLLLKKQQTDTYWLPVDSHTDSSTSERQY